MTKANGRYGISSGVILGLDLRVGTDLVDCGKLVDVGSREETKGDGDHLEIWVSKQKESASKFKEA